MKYKDAKDRFARPKDEGKTTPGKDASVVPIGDTVTVEVTYKDGSAKRFDSCSADKVEAALEEMEHTDSTPPKSPYAPDWDGLGLPPIIINGETRSVHSVVLTGMSVHNEIRVGCIVPLETEADDYFHWLGSAWRIIAVQIHCRDARAGAITGTRNADTVWEGPIISAEPSTISPESEVSTSWPIYPSEVASHEDDKTTVTEWVEDHRFESSKASIEAALTAEVTPFIESMISSRPLITPSLKAVIKAKIEQAFRRKVDSSEIPVTTPIPEVKVEGGEDGSINIDLTWPASPTTTRRVSAITTPGTISDVYAALDGPRRDHSKSSEADRLGTWSSPTPCPNETRHIAMMGWESESGREYRIQLTVLDPKAGHLMARPCQKCSTSASLPRDSDPRHRTPVPAYIEYDGEQIMGTISRASATGLRFSPVGGWKSID